jgi:type IV secretion system protein VirB8
MADRRQAARRDGVLAKEVPIVGNGNFAEYLREAQSFDDDRVERYRRSERRAWRIAAAGVVFGLCGVFSTAALAPLKTVLPPVVLAVDRSTGAVDVVTTLNGQKPVPVEDAERKHWLAEYVRAREGYTWADRQTNVHAVSLMSDANEQKRYAAWFSPENASSPQRLYGNQAFVEIHVVGVALGNVPEASANVRFERRIHEANGDARPLERLVATVTFQFSDKPMKEGDRFINPRGFEVTAYRVDPEVVR